MLKLLGKLNHRLLMQVDIPSKVYISEYNWRHIECKHPESVLEIVGIIRQPERYTWSSKGQRLLVHRCKRDKQGQIVTKSRLVLKPMKRDNCTYVNTCVTTNEPRNIRKWMRESQEIESGRTGEPSSPIGAEASLSSTSDQDLSLIISRGLQFVKGCGMDG